MLQNLFQTLDRPEILLGCEKKTLQKYSEPFPHRLLEGGIKIQISDYTYDTTHNSLAKTTSWLVTILY